MKNIPLLSIITINYKQSKVTNRLIYALQKLTFKDFELIIIDNNSGNDADNINIKFENTKLIKTKKNLGFAGGNNIGIKAAKGKYILLLNNDTEPKPDFLEPMIELFEKNPKTGAVSPKIKFFYQPDTVQYAGFSKMNPLTLRMQAIGNRQKDEGQFDKIYETNYAHGCAMMTTKKVIEKVGLMPEEYFLYYEELDWSTKIKNAGFKIYYQGHSVVLHKESVSIQKNSLLKTYFINRNRILYMRRNFRFFSKLIATIYILLVSMPKNTVSFLIKKEYKHLSAYYDAIVWNITHKTKEKWKS